MRGADAVGTDARGAKALGRGVEDGREGMESARLHRHLGRGGSAASGCGSAGTCVSVRSGGPRVWSSIFARPEAATVWVEIFDARLLSIEFLNLFGCWDSRRCVGGLRSLRLLCPHLLSDLRPCTLIGQEVFPIRKWTLGSLRSLEHGCEMRLH